MRESAIAIGTFDGVHRGHRRIIDKLVRVARARGLKSIIVTLERPVRPVPGILSTVEEKIALLRGFPVDEVIVLPITPAIITQTAYVFLRDYLAGELGCRHLVIGENFALGKGRSGNADWLKKTGAGFGVALDVVAPLCSGGDIISSSRIRKLIAAGDTNAANRLLGRFYSFSGMPHKGRGIATKLGAPTINLAVMPDKLLPPGVHTAYVEKKGKLMPGIINIGIRPTFFRGGETVPEINLLDYSGTWPHITTTVALCARLREEKHFSDQESLKRQIHRDITRARKFFGLD